MPLHFRLSSWTKPRSFSENFIQCNLGEIISIKKSLIVAYESHNNKNYLVSVQSRAVTFPKLCVMFKGHILVAEVLSRTPLECAGK